MLPAGQCPLLQLSGVRSHGEARNRTDSARYPENNTYRRGHVLPEPLLGTPRGCQRMSPWCSQSSCVGHWTHGLPRGTCVSKDTRSLGSGGSALCTCEHGMQFPAWDMKALKRVGDVPGKKESREEGRKEGKEGGLF